MNRFLDVDPRDDPTLGLCVLVVLGVATAALWAQPTVVTPTSSGPPSGTSRSGGSDGVGEIDLCDDCRGTPIVVVAQAGDADEVTFSPLSEAVTGPLGEPVLSMTTEGDISAGTLAVFMRFMGVDVDADGLLIVGFDTQTLPVPAGALAPTPDLVLPLAPDALGRFVPDMAEPVPVPLPDGLVLFVQGWFTSPDQPPSLSEAVAIVFGP